MRRRALSATVGVAVVVAIAVLLGAAVTDRGGRGSDASSEPPSRKAAQPEPARLSTPEPPAVDVLPRAQYRAALRVLALADTGTSSTVPVPLSSSDVAFSRYFPRVEHVWRFTTGQLASSMSSVDESGSPAVVRMTFVDREGYFRVEAEGTYFGRDCWQRLDPALLAREGVPASWQEGAVAASALLFDRYRPAGTPSPGTVPVHVVLGAIGMQKVVNTRPAVWGDVRVPVEVGVRDGVFRRAFVDRDHLAAAVDEAVDASGTSDDVLVQLVQALEVSPLAGWETTFTDLGRPVDIRAPARDRLLEQDGDRCER